MVQDTDLQEELIIVKAQMGDSSAFEQLIRSYHRRMVYYCKKMLLRKDLAEDVAQEVWMKAWRDLRRLRAAQAFSVWLYRIARAETIRVIRKESRYIELPDSFDLAEDISDDNDDSLAEDARLLNLAMESLNHPLREAITLRFIEGMSYEEIALITNVPVGTVRSRLHYAKQHLRRKMEEIRHEEAG